MSIDGRANSGEPPTHEAIADWRVRDDVCAACRDLLGHPLAELSGIAEIDIDRDIHPLGASQALEKGREADEVVQSVFPPGLLFQIKPLRVDHRLRRKCQSLISH